MSWVRVLPALIFFFTIFTYFGVKMKNIIKFIQESIAELKKVVWPSKDDVVAQTIVVVIGIIVTAGLLAVVDFVSLQVVSKILTLGM